MPCSPHHPLAPRGSYALIANIECAYGASADEAPPAEILALVLKCCQQLLSTIGVLASAQQEALLSRVHLALLKSKTIAADKRLILLESIQHLTALPQLPLHMYAHTPCPLPLTTWPLHCTPPPLPTSLDHVAALLT